MGLHEGACEWPNPALASRSPRVFFLPHTQALYSYTQHDTVLVAYMLILEDSCAVLCTRCRYGTSRDLPVCCLMPE